MTGISWRDSSGAASRIKDRSSVVIISFWQSRWRGEPLNPRSFAANGRSLSKVMISVMLMFEDPHILRRDIPPQFFSLLLLPGTGTRRGKRNPKSPNPKQELQPQNQREKWEKDRRTRDERGKHNASFLIRKKRRALKV